jgi:hypothetical protein
MTITTTHDPEGGGNPRLLFAAGPDHQGSGEDARIFPLPQTITRMGSDPANDLRLDGLAPFHAEIHRNEADDYILTTCSPSARLKVHGRQTDRVELHSGARIELGSWVMSFTREEFADHGRPNGGRQGGEWSAGPRVGA